MRLSYLVILILLCVIANGFYDYQKKSRQIVQLQTEIATLKASLTDKKEEDKTRQPSASDERHICPVCHGEGRVPNNGATESSAKRMSGSGTLTTYHNCPCCGGAGYRLLHIPPEGMLCPDCGGMGKVPKGAFAIVCRRCNGAGWIMPRHKIL